MNNNALMGFERLATQATKEPPLRLDVTERVIHTLHSQKVTRAMERDVVLFGGASLVAASLAMAAFWIGTADDALLPLVQPFVTVLP